MKNTDTLLHVKGKSQFTDDLIVPEGVLHTAVFSSPIAHGKITHLNLETAKQIEGVYVILTADDIQGDNQMGVIIQDEPLLATSAVHYIGQPIAIVIAKNANIARTATKAIVIEFEERPAIFDAREALDLSLAEPANLVKILAAFFNFQRPEYERWDLAADEFKSYASMPLS